MANKKRKEVRQMNRVNIQYYKTRIGELILGAHDGKLCLLDFRHRKMRSSVDHRIQKGLGAEFIEHDDEVLSRTRRQLDEYLDGERTVFDVPILMVGTDFQKKVWKALMRVRYGKTATYSELAKAVGKEKAARAVAGANGANAIAVIIPCHRIIGGNGELVGYGGGLAVKKRLLKLEREHPALSDDEKYRIMGSKDRQYDGRFFCAVKTTRIFCRPSCGARKPRRDNVVFYDSKEQAMRDGYRACKICKP
jgi:methylated-DNA-[protein]-cysteine S-methyltransferase